MSHINDKYDKDKRKENTTTDSAAPKYSFGTVLVARKNMHTPPKRLEQALGRHCKLLKVVPSLRGGAHFLITCRSSTTIALRIYEDRDIQQLEKETSDELSASKEGVSTEKNYIKNKDWDGLRSFRDSFQNPVVVFVLSPSIQADQFTRKTSVFRLAQKSVNYFPSRNIISNESKNHTESVARMMIVPQVDESLNVLADIVESLKPEKIAKKEVLFQKLQTMHSSISKSFRQWATQGLGIPESDVNILITALDGTVEELILHIVRNSQEFQNTPLQDSSKKKLICFFQQSNVEDDSLMDLKTFPNDTSAQTSLDYPTGGEYGSGVIMEDGNATNIQETTYFNQACRNDENYYHHVDSTRMESAIDHDIPHHHQENIKYDNDPEFMLKSSHLHLRTKSPTNILPFNKIQNSPNAFSGALIKRNGNDCNQNTNIMKTNTRQQHKYNNSTLNKENDDGNITSWTSIGMNTPASQLHHNQNNLGGGIRSSANFTTSFELQKDGTYIHQQRRVYLQTFGTTHPGNYNNLKDAFTPIAEPQRQQQSFHPNNIMTITPIVSQQPHILQSYPTQLNNCIPYHNNNSNRLLHQSYVPQDPPFGISNYPPPAIDETIVGYNQPQQLMFTPSHPQISNVTQQTQFDNRRSSIPNHLSYYSC